ncbi:MAG: 30S ribosomal protein S24e [Candidatus Micrarchaeota archaeon]|nr:MAG: 30S ribosomal protein S24e [Candidatus Micrarchaeota archaeon]
MRIEILEDTKIDALNRRQIRLKVTDITSTVARADLHKELCKKLALNPEATIITRIDQLYGKREALAIAHVYNSKEELLKIEPKHILKRAGLLNDKDNKADSNGQQ